MDFARANSVSSFLIQLDAPTQPSKESRKSSLPQSRVFGTELTNQQLNPLKKNVNDKAKTEDEYEIGFDEESDYKSMEEEIPAGMEAADFESRFNPQALSFYAQEIFENCKSKDTPISNSNYISSQPDLTEKMRSILIDWLVDVHSKFNLRDETLFLTVNLIDRFLCEKKILRTKLQLVGVACMLIASKYEEIYAPEVKDFTYITDNTYTKEEVLEMESEILKTLEFSLTISSPLLFIERMALLIQAEERVKMLALYMTELTFLEISFTKVSPLLLATSALYISNKLFKVPPIHWHDQLLHQISFTESQIRETAKDLCGMMKGVEENGCQAVRRKFSLPKYQGIAKVTLGKK